MVMCVSIFKIYAQKGQYVILQGKLQTAHIICNCWKWEGGGSSIYYITFICKSFLFKPADCSVLLGNVYTYGLCGLSQLSKLDRERNNGAVRFYRTNSKQKVERLI